MTESGTLWRVKTRPATLLLGLTVAVVLGVIVLTWRPWDSGTQGRITASGLVPVLTLLLGQLGSWVVSSSSTEQALAVRRAELEHDAEQRDAEAARDSKAQADAQLIAEAARIRTQFVETIRATSALGPMLANTATVGGQPKIPLVEFSAARVALLEIVPLAEADREVSDTVQAVLKDMAALYEADSEGQFKQDSGYLLTSITAFETAITTSDFLR